jgi:pimeloyl-ACP methyl ester carboxylesterase
VSAGREMKSGFAEIDGARLYYEEAGSGRALVMLHAGIADTRMWDGQFAPFAERFRVVRYDRRGFGRTRAEPAEGYSHRQDLYDLLRFLEIERAILLGCSQGAKIATDFTLEHPLVTEALVLVAPALGGFEWTGGEPAQFAELEEADRAGDLERVNELELQIWVDGTGRAPHEVDAGVRELVREMNRIALNAPTDLGTELQLDQPAINRLSEIQVPTLVITGEMDTPKTLAAASLLTEKIRGARRANIGGAAHLPGMERPEEFNRQVLSFLAGIN